MSNDKTFHVFNIFHILKGFLKWFSLHELKYMRESIFVVKK